MFISPAYEKTLVFSASCRRTPLRDVFFGVFFSLLAGRASGGIAVHVQSTFCVCGIDLFQKEEEKTGELFPILLGQTMPMTTHIFEIGCLYHRFPKNNVSQPFLQYSGSLSDALICDSANITDNQNTARRVFVLFLWRDNSQDCLVSSEHRLLTGVS